MKQIKLVSITLDEQYLQLSKYFDNRFEKLEKLYQNKKDNKYLTRREVAEMLSIGLTSVHNMTKKGVLQKYKISGKILYIKSEVELEIVKLNK
jgi:predicted DNA-binding transcriptional regulator AlpA